MDWGQVGRDMLAAGKAAAGDRWPQLKEYAETEFKTLARIAANIEARKLAGTISQVNAKFLMSQHKNATQTVLYTIEGLTNVMIEKVINDAMKVLRTAINSAIGWTLV